MGGLDRAKIYLFKKIFRRQKKRKKNYLENFCEEEDVKYLSHFAAAQNATNTKKPNRISALPQASGQASEAVSLSPSEGERCIHHSRSPL